MLRARTFFLFLLVELNFFVFLSFCMVLHISVYLDCTRLVRGAHVAGGGGRASPAEQSHSPRSSPPHKEQKSSPKAKDQQSNSPNAKEQQSSSPNAKEQHEEQRTSPTSRTLEVAELRKALAAAEARADEWRTRALRAEEALASLRRTAALAREGSSGRLVGPDGSLSSDDDDDDDDEDHDDDVQSGARQKEPQQTPAGKASANASERDDADSSSRADNADAGETGDSTADSVDEHALSRRTDSIVSLSRNLERIASGLSGVSGGSSSSSLANLLAEEERRVEAARVEQAEAERVARRAAAVTQPTWTSVLAPQSGRRAELLGRVRTASFSAGTPTEMARLRQRSVQIALGQSQWLGASDDSAADGGLSPSDTVDAVAALTAKASADAKSDAGARAKGLATVKRRDRSNTIEVAASSGAEVVFYKDEQTGLMEVLFYVFILMCVRFVCHYNYFVLCCGYSNN